MVGLVAASRVFSIDWIGVGCGLFSPHTSFPGLEKESAEQF
jgi:hypothetical protein